MKKKEKEEKTSNIHDLNICVICVREVALNVFDMTHQIDEGLVPNGTAGRVSYRRAMQRPLRDSRGLSRFAGCSSLVPRPFWSEFEDSVWREAEQRQSRVQSRGRGRGRGKSEEKTFDMGISVE